MPAPSPALASDGVLNLVISSNGTALPDTARVISVEVSKSVNKLPQARIMLADGDMPTQVFTLSDSALLAPGAKIKIEAGYGATKTLIFAGVVVKHGVRISEGNDSRLVIDCRHPAFALTLGRNNANHVSATDSDAIIKLLGACPGISVDVTATTASYDGLVQYYSSDWDFVLARAEANGLLVLCDDAGVSVCAPKTGADAVLSVNWGVDLLSFQGEIDARTQYAQVTGVAWDPSLQEVAQQSAAVVALNAQGDLDGDTLAKVGNVANLRLQSAVPLKAEALTAWAKARQVKAALARVRGSMSFSGSALAVPGCLIEIKGVGARFNGKVFVSAVEHHIVDGNWRTDAEFGMSPDWAAERHGGEGAETASGLTPGVTGLQIGVVTKLDEDPAGQHRIQVTLPVLQDSNGGVWARLASAYGSKSIGAFFIPEIGDEVIIGYFNNDPSNPVVLASLYSSARTPPYKLTAENFTKAIVTKGLIKVEFDDDKKVLTLLTPAGNTLVMSDDARSIVIKDQNGNKVALDGNGILLDSPFDIVFNAKGKISMTAVGNIEATATADLKQSATNISSTATAALTAKGTASAELSAAGQVTVKGAMVMIN